MAEDWTCPDCGEVVPLTEEATCPARADRLTRQRCAQLDRACQWAARGAYPTKPATVERIELGARGVTTDAAAGLTEADADRLIELLIEPAEPLIANLAVEDELEWWERNR